MSNFKKRYLLRKITITALSGETQTTVRIRHKILPFAFLITDTEESLLFTGTVNPLSGTDPR